ncbi:unnamed protein product [Caenorhabditis angaria]|uniref:protein-tyrosine-phosphatase n=1 Tax=Caenorhabditis angaria TaxID=860376 RepID=A0A9P1MTG3_9PELO|nr:unnamed protein product [Caenorhabditis angaria]
MQAKQYYRSFYESFMQYDATNFWNSVFIAIRQDSEQYIVDNNLSFKVARDELNANKNRYLDVAPFDQCRVRLTPTEKNTTGYVNASPVVIAEAKRNYILCQGPIETTCGDFWQMIWENNVPLIVMLNRLIENNSWKCHDYYPMKGKDYETFENWHVKLIEEIDKGAFVHRKIELTNLSTQTTRIIQHVQYIEWPDFGVPPSTECFLEMMNYCIDLNNMPHSTEEPPVVVHCSAGIGRSGSFVFIDSILRMCELEHKMEGRIEEHVLRMRRSRYGLIQTPAQLRFAWLAIIDALGNKFGLSPTNLEEIKTAEEEEQSAESSTCQKKRELIEKMVEKSRLAEKSQQNGGNLWKISISVGTIAIVAGGLAYFFSYPRNSL